MEVYVKTKIYFRSIEKSLIMEDIVNQHIFEMLEKFDRIKFAEVVVRLTRVKGRNLFSYPRFLCETILRFGKNQIVIKKKSERLEESIVDSRFALEKTLRRKLKKNLQLRNHPTTKIAQE
jgi:hypothetical protein